MVNDLCTLPFLAPRRLVVVENAEPFISTYRPQLEKYLAAPVSSGVLVLEVKNWPANTKLYKLLDGPSAIACKALTGQKLSEWCRQWASGQHNKQLLIAAAQLLVDFLERFALAPGG